MDASAGKAIASRRGAGKLRHIEAKRLFLQEIVAAKMVHIIKIAGESDPSDVFTKAVKPPVLARHLRSIGIATYVQVVGSVMAVSGK
eukprot:10447121-Alexandrium_andersonii.AAC.1